MVWISERLQGPIDGSNRNFFISENPVDLSIIVVFNGFPMERTLGVPSGMQYARDDTAITLGIAPITGNDPWARYFAEEEDNTIRVVLPQDGWQTLSDSIKGFHDTGRAVFDIWQTLADAVTAQTGGSTLTRQFTDNLSNWADVFAKRADLIAAPSADAMTFADAINGYYRMLAMLTDAMPAMTDLLGMLKQPLLTDHANFWGDSFAAQKSNVDSGIKSYQSSDSLNSWNEVTYRTIGNYLATVSDTWQTQADKTLQSIGDHRLQLVDAWPSRADSVTVFKGLNP